MVDNFDQQPKHSMYLNLICNPLKFIYFLVEWWHISSLWNCLMIKFHCWDCNAGLFTSFLLFLPFQICLFLRLKHLCHHSIHFCGIYLVTLTLTIDFFHHYLSKHFGLGMGGVERFSGDRINFCLCLCY